MRFAKAHGLGNDFILVSEGEAPGELSPWAVRLCERHPGIGGDGVVLHAKTAEGVSFRLVNADGLVGEISGNGMRCLAALAVRSGWAPARHVVRTVVGEKAVEVTRVSSSLYRIVTDLGPPGLGSRDVPVALDPPSPTVIDHPLEAAGRTVRITATSMGNPHCAVFGDEPADDALLRSLWPALEFHAFFPQRTNVEFVTVLSPSEIRVRFWERGVGYTMASDVPQCGYCQSGQIMQAVALLRKNPRPTDADIDSAMSGNICRCGTYQKVRRAIHRASKIMAKGGKI